MSSERYTYLDLVRGLSAFVVLVTHYCWLFTNGELNCNIVLTRSLPLKSVLWPIYAHGGIAVQAFWMLSGVIFFIRYGRSQMDVRKFVVWRFARLYPLHLATLLLIAAIQLISLQTVDHYQIFPNNDFYHFVINLVMANNWFYQFEPSFNAPIWSVSVEIVIYLLFVIYVRTIGPGAWKVLAVFLFSAIGWRIYPDLRLLCAAMFFLGGTIVQVLEFVRPWAGRWLALASLFFAVAALAALAITGIGAHVFLIYFIVIPAVMLLALGLDASAPPVPKQAWWIGDITYSTYLMHMPVLMIARFWLDRQPNRYTILDSFASLSVYIVVVVVVSLAVHRYFELPMQRWIQDRFHAGRARNAIEREEAQTI